MLPLISVLFFIDFGSLKKYNPDIVVRITGDCPLIDPKIVDKCIELFLIFQRQV